MNRNVMSVLIVCFAICHAGLSLAGEPYLTLNAKNNYDFNNDKAFVLEKVNSERHVVRVDFNSKSERVVISGQIAAYAVNKDATLLAYFDKAVGKVVVQSLADGQILYSGGRADLRMLYWSGYGDQLAFYDEYEGTLYEVVFNEKVIVRTATLSGLPIAVKWSSDCGCFEYSFMSIDGGGIDGVIRVVGGEVVPVVRNEMMFSPDGKYYVKPWAIFETGNYITVHDSANGEILSRFDTAGLLKGGVALLWKNHVLRLIGYPSGSINLEKGEVLASRNGDLLKDDVPRAYSAKNYYDIGSDSDGYVLMWNRERKVFEVEDILSGATVKTYDKFW